MKAVILHGPAISSSRGKLIEIKKKFDSSSVVSFDPSTSSGQIMAALQTVSMFSEERLIIAENPPDDFSKLTLYPNPLPAGRQANTLILWFDREIDPTKWPKAEVFFFPEAKETSVFPLLDKLAEKNDNAYLELDKLKKAEYDSQYFITMIFYLLRSLIYLPKNAHPFVKQKMEKQRRNFSRDEIISLYKFVLETDFKIKKGLMETNQAEFLLVNKFTG